MQASWEGRLVEEWRQAWRLPALEVHPTLPSTMERAWSLAEAGAEVGTLVLAEEQTAGRGRSGRSWHSPPGQGLWMSWILPPLGARLPVLPLRVGLRLARGIEAVAAVAVDLKWPNDLWLDGRKLGGVLTETRGGQVVVGVGLNVRPPPGGFPAELAEVAVALEERAGPVGRGALATALLDALGGLASDPGPGKLTPEEHRDLTGRDLLRGRPLRTSVGDGTGAGVRRDGALLLQDGSGAVRGVVAGGVEIL